MESDIHNIRFQATERCLKFIVHPLSPNGLESRFTEFKKFLSFFFLFIFLLKDNCVTKFCCFLLNLNMNQP